MKSSEKYIFNNFCNIAVTLALVLFLWYMISMAKETNDLGNKLEADFIKKHGSSKIVSCENGFLMQHTAFRDDLVYNDTLHSPVRCVDNVNIQVKETARTGLLFGDVN